MSSPALAQTLPVTTTSEEARKHFEAGRAAAFHWNVTQAHEHLDAAIADDSSFVLAYLHRAGSSPHSERQRYFEHADAHADRVSEDERRMIEAFRAFLLEEDYDRAVAIFRDLSEKYQSDPYLPGYLGLRYYMNLGRYDEAVEQFHRALERDSSFVQAHNFLGHVALAKEDYAAAEQAFRRYVRLSPDQPQAYRSLGTLYRHTGRYDEAAAYYEQVLERDPDFFGGWIRPGWMRDVLGSTYLEAERYDEAERVFRENVRRHPDDPNTYDSLGELYLSMGRYEEAAAQFEQALARDPDFSSSRDNLIKARIEQANRRFEEAFGGHDSPAMAALYTKDGQLLPAGSGVVEGIEAIRRYWEGVFEAGFTSADLETLEVYVGADGEVATEVGRYRLTANDQEADAGKYIVVWQRTPEGWRLHRDIWTTDQAPGE